MKKDFTYYQAIAAKCFFLQRSGHISFDETELKSTLFLIDECIDAINAEFCANGLQADSEPNAYGFELEDAKDYFLRLRWSIVG